MKKVIALTLLAATLTTGCASTCVNYVKVGVGYKFDEAKVYHNGKALNDPISARGELGRQCASYSYGISHHSQPFSNAPFNNKWEYYKTEFFVDKTFYF